ncbi:MAG: recombination protein RecR [Candidatus Magnetoglobus multicellularis str. Araruama]|uniref:Recombination protein RecR n=1 Tax=Candidatus Magnetoglobus multicellularis str. Araruama TaxID=890399 RepID=A0A1V1P8I6_9BACT|nr:MAG: recombination protein RecR [Candidatus Magnetoglobus multicellularis str. Araruama]
MRHYPPSLIALIRQLSKLPGIGEKSATRLALHILKSSAGDAKNLADCIYAVKEKIHFCPGCFGLTDQALCHICSDPDRVKNTVCVVEQTDDMASIERSGSFKGMYHVLHGTLSPMNGIGPDDIRLRELYSRVEKDRVHEIIIATSTNVEGEATATYIVEQLSALPVKLSRIATGVPMGGDLKFVDQITLKCALERRYEFETPDHLNK